MNKYLKQATYAAEESGSSVLNYFKKIENVSKKNKNLRDLVTEVDLVSEKIILSILKSKFNKHRDKRLQNLFIGSPGDRNRYS